MAEGDTFLEYLLMSQARNNSTIYVCVGRKKSIKAHINSCHVKLCLFSDYAKMFLLHNKQMRFTNDFIVFVFLITDNKTCMSIKH